MKLLKKTKSFWIVYLIFMLIFSEFATAKETKPLRLVSLKPNITFILQQLGVASQIVGRTKFCPAINDEALVVGDYNSFDVEAIVRLKPDLILLSTENSQSSQFDLLKAQGLSVTLFDFQNFTAMKNSYKEIATLVGKVELADETIKQMQTKLETLRTLFAQPGKISPQYILLVQRRPLMVATQNTYMSSLLDEIGFKNVFAANAVTYPVLDEEEFIREVVDYTFEFSHEGEVEKTFLNKEVISLPIQNFLAHPQSVDHLVDLIKMLKQ